MRRPHVLHLATALEHLKSKGQIKVNQAVQEQHDIGCVRLQQMQLLLCSTV